MHKTTGPGQAGGRNIDLRAPAKLRPRAFRRGGRGGGGKEAEENGEMGRWGDGEVKGKYIINLVKYIGEHIINLHTLLHRRVGELACLGFSAIPEQRRPTRPPFRQATRVSCPSDFFFSSLALTACLQRCTSSVAKTFSPPLPFTFGPAEAVWLDWVTGSSKGRSPVARVTYRSVAGTEDTHGLSETWRLMNARHWSPRLSIPHSLDVFLATVAAALQGWLIEVKVH